MGKWLPFHTDYVERLILEELNNQDEYPTMHQVVEIRKLVERFAVFPTHRKWNDRKEFINLQNGMFNLEDRTLHEHSQGYLSTIQLNVTYDPGASCPRWEQFLEEVLDNEEDIAVIQEFMGYCLVPDTRFEKCLLMLGEGANGKSKLIRVLLELVGLENTSAISMNSLNDQFIRVSLHNKLLNTSSELNPKLVESTEYFKKIVSGDLIQATLKHKDGFAFEPFCRLVFAMNEMPQSGDTSHGFYRRLLMIPFYQTFDDEDADRKLLQKLLSELDGIFNWTLDGHDRLFKQDGFTRSENHNKLLRTYKRENSSAVTFMEERCEFANSLVVAKDDLYVQYKIYAETFGYKPVNRKNFFKELYRAHPQLKKTRPIIEGERVRRIEGVGLKIT